MSFACTILASLLSLWLTGAASAVIIDSSDGTGNTAAPSPDPGWSYVGTRGGLTAVYLGDGWVLTANHVGAGDVTLSALRRSGSLPGARRPRVRHEHERDG